MGEWKVSISVRVRQDLRRELEEFACKDRRKLSNLAELLIEWAFEQLKVAGSPQRLLNFHIKRKLPPPPG
jgi:hypothetical protein